MTRIEFGLERTTCACKVCVTNCRFMPGFLLPSDLERMIPETADPLVWSESNLLASPGALVMKGSDFFRIPTLVPAVKPDGSCKNLTAEGLCSIHEDAPFGCAFFDCGPERDHLSHRGISAVYIAWCATPPSLYAQVWTYLSGKNLVQQKAETLRMKMQAALEVERLRNEGWTQPDFAEALKKELEKS